MGNTPFATRIRERVSIRVTPIGRFHAAAFIAHVDAIDIGMYIHNTQRRGLNQS